MTQGTLVMVKIGKTGDGGGMLASDGFKAVEWTINDIIGKKRQGRSVINFSMGAGKLTATAFIIAFVY
jgi:hypothetical protein